MPNPFPPHPAATLVEAEAQHINAMGALEARIVEAIKVMQGPGRRSQEELVAAAATLATYGDVITAQRAELVLQAIRSAPEIKRFADQAVRQEQRAGFRNPDIWLRAVLIVGGGYIVVGIVAALVQRALG